MAYSINKDQVIWRVLDGEATLIHTQTTFYYGLNSTGTFIWNLLNDGEASLEQIVQAVGDAYEVEPASIADDIKQLLEELKQEQLILER